VHHSPSIFEASSTSPSGIKEDTDEPGLVITTFSPTPNLEQFKTAETNVTVPVPATELIVPLPNFDKERFSSAVFQPTPAGFSNHEPAFSDVAAVKEEKDERMEPAVESATEIVRVSSKDQQLFDSDYNYEEYYYDQINS